MHGLLYSLQIKNRAEAAPNAASLWDTPPESRVHLHPLRGRSAVWEPAPAKLDFETVNNWKAGGMMIRAVVFDIGGVLEINPDTGWQSKWE